MAPLDLAAVHREALERVGFVVARIDHAALANPTPCSDWDVRELLNHVVAGNLWAVRLVGGETIEAVGTALDGDQLGDDFAAAYRKSAAAAAAAFEAPGALEAPCAVSYGPVPGSVYAGHRFIDVLVHGWDLAVATKQSLVPPPDLVAALWEVVEPQLAMLQGSGAFGHEDGAAPEFTDPFDRLLHALGRDPGAWR
jgi:uncharacterized protein (TIGR03086 family)